MSSGIRHFLDERALGPIGITAAGCDYDRPPVPVVTGDAASLPSAETDPFAQRVVDARPAATPPRNRKRIRPGGVLASAPAAWALSITVHVAIAIGAMVALGWMSDREPSPTAGAAAAAARDLAVPNDGGPAGGPSPAAWWAFVTAGPTEPAAGGPGTGGNEMDEPAPAEPTSPAAVRIDPTPDVPEERIAPADSVLRAPAPDFRRQPAIGPAAEPD